MGVLPDKLSARCISVAGTNGCASAAKGKVNACQKLIAACQRLRRSPLHQYVLQLIATPPTAGALFDPPTRPGLQPQSSHPQSSAWRRASSQKVTYNYYYYYCYYYYYYCYYHYYYY